MQVDLAETPRWRLIHKLNGELLRNVRDVLCATIRWDPTDWICNTIYLDRSIGEAAEITFHTSATIYRGVVFDESREGVIVSSESKGPNEDSGSAVWGLNRLVPLVGSYSSYCIWSGNTVWDDDIKETQSDPNNPLATHYRPWKFVSVDTESVILSEYVFPLSVRVGSNSTVVGVLNLETWQETEMNALHQYGQAIVLGLVLPMVEMHGAFLVAAEEVASIPKFGTDPPALEPFLTAHRDSLRSFAEKTKLLWKPRAESWRPPVGF
jgi:hypothetical protein